MPLFAYLELDKEFDFSKHPNIPESKSANFKIFANFASKRVT
jgi:hypothetical protein